MYDPGRIFYTYEFSSYCRFELSVRGTDKRERYQAIHHVQKSVLEDLPIDMVKQFPIADSLHLIDVGELKRLVHEKMMCC